MANLLNSKRKFLLMVSRTAVYHKRAVNLLAQHYAHKLMRKGKFAERHFKFAHLLDAVVLSVRAAYYESFGGVGVFDFFQLLRKLYAGKLFAAYIQTNAVALYAAGQFFGLRLFYFVNLSVGKVCFVCRALLSFDNFRLAKSAETFDIFFYRVGIKFFFYLAYAQNFYLHSSPVPFSAKLPAFFHLFPFVFLQIFVYAIRQVFANLTNECIRFL